MFHRTEGVAVAGRYRLVRKLGTGGMGTVWLAQDILLDSSCALKLIDDDKAESEEVRIRFEREAKVAAQLRGPHVVDVFDHGEWSGVPYIAMEFLDGEDLGTRLDRVKRLDPAATYRVVAHVARALVKAHAYGIVHRDLKPENVFLVEGDEGEIAKVLDFGIAKHDQYSLRDKTTKTGSFLGTPFYVSPEQARGKPTDHRSDLWSLGVIAFQCLTGKPPFESEALGELMGMILYDDMPVPTQRNPELPPEIDDWWRRAAARDREQRFDSAKDLADALGVALGVSRPIVVQSVVPRRVSLTEIDPALAPDGRETDAPLSSTRISSLPGAPIDLVSRIRARFITSRMWFRRVPRRHLAAAAVVAGIVAGAALTFVATSSGPSSTTTVAAPVNHGELAEGARPGPRPSVYVDESAPRPEPAPSVVTPPPSALAPAPSSSAPLASDAGTKRARGVPPARTPAKKAQKGRDYGI
ncbi:MAG TPA: serine/threonine-protein kinase [Polyangiaceae bacterium]